MKDLVTLLVALCFSEFIHNMIEIWGIRQKVEWLGVSLDGKKHGHWPVNINTKLKTIILHTLILLVTGGLAFLVLRFLNLANERLVIVGMVIVIVSYIITTWKVDKFHTEIGRLISQAKTKKTV